MVGSIRNILSPATIPGLTPVGSLQATMPTTATYPMGAVENAGNPETINFEQVLTDALSQVNALQQSSSQMTEDFIAGKTDSIHEVMIAGEKASLSLQLALEIRNKVLEAYQEINRMQI